MRMKNILGLCNRIQYREEISDKKNSNPMRNVTSFTFCTLNTLSYAVSVITLYTIRKSYFLLLKVCTFSLRF